MRVFIFVVFFALLVTQLGLRNFGPTPTPGWARVVLIASGIGMILCLTVPPIIAWARGPRPEGEPPAPPAQNQ